MSAPPILPTPRADTIGNTPDRGALVNYDRRTPPVKQGAYTSHAVQVSEDHAIKAIVTGKLRIPAPNGEYLKLTYERHQENTNGNWTWVGRLAGAAGVQEAIITFGEKAIFGSIPQGEGRPDLKLTTRAGKLYVVETDSRLAPGTDRRAQDTLVPLASARSRLASASSTLETQTASTSAVTAKADSSNTIDLLLGYTAGFAAKFGGQSQAVTRLTHLVEVNNQAYVNSQIDGAIRLVGTQQVNYTDGGTNKSALVDLTGNSGSGATTIPASLQPLRAARDQLGADLVALVRVYEYVNEGCGIAWLIGANQDPIVASADQSFGYAVVSNLPDGQSVQGTDGKNYFCARETLAHELAHLMGSAHDADNAKNDAGAQQYGRYLYSFGAKTTPAAGNFYTIMAYGDDGQTAYRVFSNPNLTTCGGVACGVANQSDNARSLNQTIPIIVGFRASVVPAARPAYADANNDGRSDIFWHSVASQSLQYWAMNGATWVYGPTKSVASQYRVGGVGDFNGDGLADVVWYDQSKSAATSVYIWAGGAGGQFVVSSVRSYPAGWNIVGVADMNNDGRADIVWHNPTAGALEYWLMSGNSITYGGARSVPSIYRVAAVADLNGDGRADVVWQNAAKTELWVWQGSTTGAFSILRMGYAAGYPQGWDIVGTGDANGDGRSDLYWHNPAAQALEYWLMNGTAIVYGGARSVPSKYRVATVGDFNGDGLSDVVWRDDAKTELWLWQASPGGPYAITRLAFPGGYPGGWDIVGTAPPVN